MSPERHEASFDKQSNRKEVINRLIHSNVLEIINEARESEGLPAFYENINLVPAAQSYAEYFVRDESDEVNPNPKILEGLIKEKQSP